MRKTLIKLEQLPKQFVIEPDAHKTEAVYKFRVPAEYLKLIDPQDPQDPIAKLVLPSTQELIPLASLDPSAELSFTVAPGLQHKFSDTALILTTTNCAGYCRYCFRKRLFQPDNREVPSSFQAALAYIHKHPEISNVLLSGGDPFSLKTAQLLDLLQAIVEIPHVRMVRLGSKTPAFDPQRILEDTPLLRGLEKLAALDKQFFLIAHFDHPRELTTRTKACVKTFMKMGFACLNQCPLLNGVNSAPGVLSTLFEEMAAIGCPQYYVFHCRPTDGNTGFSMPIAEAFSVFERECRMGSGLSKTARYCIAHPTGKLQVLAQEGSRLLIKYIQACNPQLTGHTFWQATTDDLASLPLNV